MAEEEKIDEIDIKAKEEEIKQRFLSVLKKFREADEEYRMKQLNDIEENRMKEYRREGAVAIQRMRERIWKAAEEERKRRMAEERNMKWERRRKFLEQF